MPQHVNPQIVDAVTTTTTATIGEAASLAMGMFFQIEAQAFAMALQNAVTSQRGMQQVGEAVVAAACTRLLSLVAASPPPPPPPPK
jgi:hypothetical protein